ncbi:MAG: rRNA methyltransferase [Gammaproteobacteria bacterium RIFCSPHIGHO2_12_FULL_35_23]|nr:MAG: rRNA methyltransferase [Gammaproteobacteria bacterium RIFCSPHIGHO2_12_FULL_35_23]
MTIMSYYGIGIYSSKTKHNLGTLWRSAFIYGASFIFLINSRYSMQASDTLKSVKHIPLFHYDNFDDFYNNLPYGAQLIGVELSLNAFPIKEFSHPKIAIYLLGSEDNGLSNEIISKCHQTIILPGEKSLNVSVAGSIVMFDRINKFQKEIRNF